MFARVRAAISDAWRCRRVRRRVPQFVSTLPIFNRLDEEARLTERAEQVIETNTQIEISSELDTPSRISRPRYKWPSRKRSRSESAGSEDQDIPTRTPKRPRFLPPHRGYLLSPIGEESETPRKAASEPSEGYLSDPMDLDGDSFNADVARVNAGLYEPLPGDSNPQLKPSKKRKSLAQDGDATYLPERPGCQDAVGVTPSDDSDFEIPVPPRKRRGIVSEFEREKARRLEIVRDRHDDSWGEAEKRLDSRLGMLGFEPLMPKHWHFDFRTLPVSVFGVPEAGSEPVIRASGGSDFRADKSLTELFAVGGRVRDCRVLNLRSETVIKRGIRSYLRWAIRDGGVRATPDTTPVCAICCQRKGESTLNVLERLDRRLKELGRRYGAGQPHPVLVGFAVCGPICAIVSHDTHPDRFGMVDGQPMPRLKFLCQLDMSDQAQDVWNALSLAIAVSHVREEMAGLAAQGAGGFRLGNEGEGGEDEDL